MRLVRFKTVMRVSPFKFVDFVERMDKVFAGLSHDLSTRLGDGREQVRNDRPANPEHQGPLAHTEQQLQPALPGMRRRGVDKLISG